MPRFQYKSLIFWLVLLVSHSCFAENDPPFELPAANELKKLRSAIIYTEYGNIHLELFPEDAPWHVANLKWRADKGYYKNTYFTYHEKNYLIQGGSPKNANKKSPYFLPPEFTGLKHEPGAFGMARIPDSSNPERLSHARQFYVVTGYAPHMNGQYTIFGRVTKGLDVAERLRKGDRIVDLKVFVRPNVNDENR